MAGLAAALGESVQSVTLAWKAVKCGRLSLESCAGEGFGICLGHS